MYWSSGGAAGAERRPFSQEDRPMLSVLARRVWAVLLAVGGLLGGATGVLAQNTISLHGRVTATDGKPLVAAQVAVLNRETGQQRSALTSAEGTYTIVGLPPGAYRVRLVLLGYRAQERDIELLVGQRASLDFELQEAAVAVEGVAVTHQREPVFEVQRNDVSTPVVSAEILNLPLNTRNTINLAAIVPGMKTFAPTAGRALPAAAGGDARVPRPLEPLRCPVHARRVVRHQRGDPARHRRVPRLRVRLRPEQRPQGARPDPAGGADPEPRDVLDPGLQPRPVRRQPARAAPAR